MSYPTSMRPAPRRRLSRRKPSKVQQPAPPAPPVLVQVMYEEGSLVKLVFDQPVDAAGFDVALLQVQDASTELAYEGLNSGADSPTTIEVTLETAGSADPGPTRMTVGPGNGIVSVETGLPWAGVTELPVPFP